MRSRRIASQCVCVALLAVASAGRAWAADGDGEGQPWSIGLYRAEGDRVARCEPTPIFRRLASGKDGGPVAAVAADHQSVAAFLEGPRLEQEQVLVLDLRGEVVRRFPLYEVGECARRWRGARGQPVPRQVLERVRVLNDFLRAGGYRGMRAVERDAGLDQEGRRPALRHGKLQVQLEVESQRLEVSWAGGVVLSRKISTAHGRCGSAAEGLGTEFRPDRIAAWVFKGYAVVMIWYGVGCECSRAGLNAWVGPVRLP